MTRRLRGRRVGVHRGATPCAEKTTVAPSGTSSSLLDEDRAAPRQLGHDVAVVDDLLAHVDRRAGNVERPLDGLDGAVDAGAVAARGGEQEAARCHGGVYPGGVRDRQPAAERAGDAMPLGLPTVSPRRQGPVTNQDRVFLVVALVALALVALATSLTLLLARSRAQVRAPLAGALTFSLLCIAITAGVGAVAVIAGVERAGRRGGARGRHRDALHRPRRVCCGASTGRWSAATPPSPRRGPPPARRCARWSPPPGWPSASTAPSSLDEIDALLSDAARRALPEAVVAIVPAEPPHEGLHVDVPLRTATTGRSAPPGPHRPRTGATTCPRPRSCCGRWRRRRRSASPGWTDAGSRGRGAPPRRHRRAGRAPARRRRRVRRVPSGGAGRGLPSSARARRGDRGRPASTPPSRSMATAAASTSWSCRSTAAAR